MKIMRAAGRLARRKGLPSILTPDAIMGRRRKVLPAANALLEMHLTELGLRFMREHKFHPTRKWKFDYVLWDVSNLSNIAIEIEGGVWMRGRHTRGKGYQNDMEKYNAATALGWRVFRFSTEDVLRGRAKDFLRENAVK